MKNAKTLLFSFIAGSAALCVFSAFQKFMLGMQISIHGFYVPFFAGGCFGMLIGMRQKKLVRTNTKLKEEVNRRIDIEAALRDSEAKYKDLYENAPDMHFSIDPVTRNIVSCNQVLLNTLGYTEKEVIGRPCIAFYAPQSAKRMEIEVLPAFLKTGTIENEDLQLKKKDGSIVDVNLKATAVYDQNGDIVYSRSVWRDITEEKKAEQKLTESENNYSEIFNATSEAIIIHDAKTGAIVDANNVVHDLFGYSIEEVLKLKVEDLSSGESPFMQEEAHRKITKAVEAGPQVFDWKSKRKNGEVFWSSVSLRASQISGQGRVLAVIRDVSDRKRAERSIRENEFQLNALLNHQFQLTGLIDKEGRLIKANKTALELAGIASQDVIGKYFWETPWWAHSQAEQTKLREGMRQAMRGETVNFESTHVSVSGETRIIDFRIRPVFDDEGEVIYLVPEGFDITERKHAEAERELLISAIEQAAETIVVTDTNATIKYVNPAFEKTTGYTRESVLGHNPRFLQSGEQDDAFYRDMWAALLRGEAWKGRLVNKKKDGTTFTEEATISPVLDASGKTVNYVAVKRDITQEIQIQDKLRQAQKMESLGTLAGGIAHDFNNILSSIIGYTELTKMDAPQDDQLVDYLNSIMHAGDRAKALVQQILTFSRQTEQEFKPVSVKIVVQEALKLLRASLPTSIDIKQSLRSDALVMGDPTQIHQIIMNLCTNAGHAMRAKGGILRVESTEAVVDEAKQPQLSGLKPGRYLNLTIADTGQGMPPEVLDQIFDPFYTTKERGEGTGLGLAVVHGIVNSYGGTIHAYSEPGIGSSFRVYLPAIKSTSEAKVDFDESTPGGEGWVLIVDDEPDIVEIGRKMLESLGYQVASRTSSLEALELIRDQPQRFDLVITDMTMPKMTGDKLAAEILSIRQDIPIILCTGFADPIAEEKAKVLGIKGILMKPILRVDLARAVSKAMNAANGASVD